MFRVLFIALATGPRGVGISRYCLELARHLVQANGNIDIAIGAEFRDYFPKNARILCKKTSAITKIFYEQILLTLGTGGYSLIHSGDLTAPIFCSKPVVVTLHDLTFFRYPEMFALPQRTWRKYMGKFATLRKAEIVICVSEATRKDAVELLGIPQEKTRVIYPGVKWLTTDDLTCHRDEPYILFVGTLEPKKNLIRLVKACDIIKKKGLRHRLVIVGNKGHQCERIFNEVEKLNLKKDVIFLGYVGDHRLATLYRNADLFVFPSIHEGFGFPPLEAMVHKTPVVVSRTASLPEVCGDAAHYVDPYDENDIAEGLYRVLTDQTLRDELRCKGQERVKTFSWERTAEKTLKVYEEICGR